jgi:hypothetical protein
VGTPRTLTPPPCGFGISTARTGGGKYVPDESRFQILYKLFFRSVSNSASDCPSTPGAPLFALTRLYASHTNRLEMSNALSVGPDLPTRLLPDSVTAARLLERTTHR